MIRAGSSEFQIEIADDDSFVEAVREGTADPYTGIRIVSGDRYLYGSEDRWPENWVTHLTNSFLETIPDLADGERTVVTNHNGPSYFVFEPTSDGAIHVTHVFSKEAVDDPDRRTDSMPAATITFSSFASTIIDLGRALHERIVTINVTIASEDDLRRLAKNVDTATSILDEQHNDF